MSKLLSKTCFKKQYDKVEIDMANNLLENLLHVIESNKSFLSGEFYCTFDKSKSTLKVFLHDEEVASYSKNKESHNLIAYNGINHNYHYITVSHYYHSYKSSEILGIGKLSLRSIEHDGISSTNLELLFNRLKRNVLGYYARKHFSSIKIDENTSIKRRFDGVHKHNDMFYVQLSLYINLHKFDDRYFTINSHSIGKLDYQGQYIINDLSFPIDSDIELDDVEKLIDDAVSSVLVLFTEAYEKYDEYERTNGGCKVIVQKSRASKIYLCHRNLQPTINSSFLTFMCPYTKDIVTINISDTSSIQIQNMEEHHQIGQTQILLG